MPALKLRIHNEEKVMKKLVVLLLLTVIVLAQDSEKRIISIDSSGGTQTGNIRYGPIIFEHPEAEGIKAKVSNLEIFANKAELRGPETEGERITLAKAKGQRIAIFPNGVRIVRSRLEASGPVLSYNEATGLGVLTGGADITVSPKDETSDAEPVLITADQVEFDVDTDISISKGNVNLVNGKQRAEADELEYEEERTLGVLTCEEKCTATRLDDDGSVITIIAQEIRVLTDSNLLFASGDVSVIDGSLITTGDSVFFDDEKNIAEIIGSPAVSVDSTEGVTVKGDRLLQDIEYDVVEVIDASVKSEFNQDAFILSREQ